jgi:hypothetical protein
MRLRLLTVAGHSHGETFLEAAVLTAVPVQPDDQTLPVPQAAILYLLLDAAPEEALQHNTLLLTPTKYRLMRDSVWSGRTDGNALRVN